MRMVRIIVPVQLTLNNGTISANAGLPDLLIPGNGGNISVLGLVPGHQLRDLGSNSISASALNGIGGQITPLAIVKGVFLASLINLVVPLAVVAWLLKGRMVVVPPGQKDESFRTTLFERNLTFYMGLGILLLGAKGRWQLRLFAD